jgi:myosin heavy subunit
VILAVQLLSSIAVLTDHQSCVALSNVCRCCAVQGECYDLSRVEDDDEFLNTKKAMQLMGFSAEDQVQLEVYIMYILIC